MVRYRPCQGPPMKWTWIFSVTSIEPFGETTISASNFSIRSCLLVKEKQVATKPRNSSAAVATRRSETVRKRMRSAVLLPSCLRRTETDLWGFPFRRSGNFKELPFLEAQHIGKNVGRELLDLGVEIAHHRVVIAPRILDGIFNLRKGILQRGEAFDGAELRIGFGEREEAFQRAGEHVFRLCLVGGRGGSHGAVACIDDAFERVLLVRGVAFHGLDEIGDQVVAALELHVDISPGVVALNFQAHQAVVHADEEDNEQYENAQKDQTSHRRTSRAVK